MTAPNTRKIKLEYLNWSRRSKIDFLFFGAWNISQTQIATITKNNTSMPLHAERAKFTFISSICRKVERNIARLTMIVNERSVSQKERDVEDVLLIKTILLENVGWQRITTLFIHSRKHGWKKKRPGQAGNNEIRANQDSHTQADSRCEPRHVGHEKSKGQFL